MSRLAKTLVLCLFLSTTTCGGEGSNSTEVQRSVTESVLPDGTTLTALSGAIRTSGEDTIARFTAPAGTLTVTTTPDVAGEKSFLLDNLDPDSDVVVRIAQSVTGDEVDGCSASNALILCADAQAAAGSACPTDGCPTGTLCENDVCTPTRALSRCNSTVADVEGLATRKRLTYTPEPCIRTIFEIVPPEVDTTRFVVSGAGSYVSVLNSLRMRAEAGEIDFIVFLGDNLVDSSPEGVSQMSADALEYPIPIVAIPGELESNVTESPRFVGRFGPGDFAFQYGPLRAFAFTSAGRHLGTRGLDRIRSLIRLATRNESEATLPIISFTHVPPVDPNGARDLGFINEIEAARTLSLLTENGVDALIAGHIRAGDSADYGELQMYVTSAEEGFLGGELELLEVTVGPASSVDGAVIGNFAYSVERIPR